MMHPKFHAQTKPAKVAYCFPHSGEKVTYVELERDSNKIAHLIRSIGLAPGEGITLLMENHPWFFKILWAAQRSGLYYTPISTQFQAREISYVIDNADARVLFVSKKLLPKVLTTNTSECNQNFTIFNLSSPSFY